jgi:hypothetical protein
VRTFWAWLIRCSAPDALFPRSILQSQTYILSTLHAAITVYILMFSAYSHFDAFNPLAPDLVTIPERSGSRPVKTWSVLTEVVWWLWIAGSFGWAGEVGRIWVGSLGFERAQTGTDRSTPRRPNADRSLRSRFRPRLSFPFCTTRSSLSRCPFACSPSTSRRRITARPF